MLRWYNGTFSKEAIRVEPHSQAFRYGIGFFTTTRIVEYLPLWLEAHLERLENSLCEFQMGSLDIAELEEAAFSIALKNQLKDGIMRITVWPENDLKLNALIALESISLENFKPYRIMKSSFIRHSSQKLNYYKTLNYWPNYLVFKEAHSKTYDDGLILNEKNEVCETSRSNIFWVKDNILNTPDIACGLLAGILRQKIIDIAHSNKIEVKLRKSILEDLLLADGVFVTNSVRGIVAVEEIEGINFNKQLGDNLISILHNGYQRKIDKYIRQKR